MGKQITFDTGEQAMVNQNGGGGCGSGVTVIILDILGNRRHRRLKSGPCIAVRQVTVNQNLRCGHCTAMQCDATQP